MVDGWYKWTQTSKTDKHPLIYEAGILGHYDENNNSHLTRYLIFTAK